MASAKKLIEAGRIPRNESIVLVITGNGLKTQDPLVNNITKPYIIEPKIEDFNKIFD